MEVLEVVLAVLEGVAVAVAGWAGGRLLRFLFIRLFRRFGLDDWFRGVHVGRALLKSGYTPGEFFGAVASWFVYLSAFLLAASLVAYRLGYVEVWRSLLDVLSVYLFGFAKFFVVAIIGFILVDGFAEYIHKGALSREEAEVALVADYLRIVLYLVVITFALEQGGINVSTLSAMLTPIAWGITAAIVAVLVVRLVRK